MAFRFTPLLALAACWMLPAHAGDVYKCVDANGKVTFSDQECDDKVKTSKVIEVPPLPPADKEAGARQARQKEMEKLNKDFENRRAERLKAEAAAEQAQQKVIADEQAKKQAEEDAQRKADAESKRQGAVNARRKTREASASH